MTTTSIKVDSAVRDRLLRIAKARGTTMGALLDEESRRLEDERLWERIEAGYESFQRDDPNGWREYLAELAEWEAFGDPDPSAASEWPEYNR